MKAVNRRWTSSRWPSTSASDKSFFCAVILALKASMPPYVTEYRGGLPPARIKMAQAIPSAQILSVEKSGEPGWGLNIGTRRSDLANTEGNNG